MVGLLITREWWIAYRHPPYVLCRTEWHAGHRLTRPMGLWAWGDWFKKRHSIFIIDYKFSEKYTILDGEFILYVFGKDDIGN